MLLQALGRILTLDASEDQGRFEEFMQPMAATFRTLQQELSGPVHPAAAERLQSIVLGLARDLRGIAVTCANKPSYTLLFEWIYPDYLPVSQ